MTDIPSQPPRPAPPQNGGKNNTAQTQTPEVPEASASPEVRTDTGQAAPQQPSQTQQPNTQAEGEAPPPIPAEVVRAEPQVRLEAEVAARIIARIEAVTERIAQLITAYGTIDLQLPRGQDAPPRGTPVILDVSTNGAARGAKVIIQPYIPQAANIETLIGSPPEAIATGQILIASPIDIYAGTAPQRPTSTTAQTTAQNAPPTTVTSAQTPLPHTAPNAGLLSAQDIGVLGDDGIPNFAPPAAGLETLIQTALIAPLFEVTVLQSFAAETPIEDVIQTLVTVDDADAPAAPNQQANPAEAAPRAPAAMQATPTPPQNSFTAVAEVVGHSPSGLPQFTFHSLGDTPLSPALKTDAPLNLITPANAAIGQSFEVSIVPRNAEQLANAGDRITHLPSPVLAALSSLPSFTHTLPLDPLALNAALETLQTTAPTVAQGLQSTLPSPGARMVPTALFFIAALRLGGIENWTGKNTIDALSKLGKSDIAQKMASEFSRLSGQMADPAVGQWKHIPLPMLHDGYVSQIELYVKRDPHGQSGRSDSDDKDSTAPEATRFLVDLELSAIGPLQIDGYLAPEKLDMVVRTDHALPNVIENKIRDRYATALELTGLDGNLRFQNQRSDFIQIQNAEDTGGILI